jgi:ubiquinone/menaquinone biosynthesis C-methylase UbiE
MGKEIDLLIKYPKIKRDLTKRLESKTEEIRLVARKFDKEFFDGERKFGYGGFSYNPGYWSEVVKDFSDYYNLNNGSKILDVGCAKGFMLYDFYKLNPNLDLYGIDISKYAIDNSVSEIKHKLQVANARKLPFEDNFFDLVISINTIHNLDKVECATALKEISRVSKKNAFLTVDAYRNNEEKQRMDAWNLTAKTIMPVDDWIKFFKKNQYKGDYFWFIP